MDARDRLTEMMDKEKETLSKLEGELRTLKARNGAFQQALAALGPNAEEVVTLGVLRRLQDKMKKEQASVDQLEAAVVDSQGRVAAFEDALKLFPKDGEEIELRPGSQLAEVRRVLKEKGSPMVLSEILEALGKSAEDVKVRNSLRGSLAKYAQDGRVFTKEEEPDTFGLLEFRSTTEQK
jgi:hypothetical protein